MRRAGNRSGASTRWAMAALVVAGALAGPGAVAAQSPGAAGALPDVPLWADATAPTTGPTGQWTNKVEIADVDGDGLLDILHANGGDYDTPGTPARQAILLNQGDGTFRDATDEILGDARYLARVIKARDMTGDGITDLLIGTTFGTQTRFLRGLGAGQFEDQTEPLLPDQPLSVGDLEVGDLDGDLDLDIVLADRGEGSPMRNAGGPVRLWMNFGEGWAPDPSAIPSTPVGFSWDIELVDVDLDWDLDIAVSCKMCPTSRLYRNDGTGRFEDVTAEVMPASSNNSGFEAMDLDGDGDPDLATINDGPQGPRGFPERLLRNEGGTFADATADWLPAVDNPGWDDNVVVFLDADSDGDADLLVGSLDGPDRLLVNDGTGRLSMRADVFDGPPTPGTLGLAVGDLDGDARLDVVEGAGEVSMADHVFLANDALPPDAAAPSVGGVTALERAPGVIEVRARVHDRKTPVLREDFRDVRLEIGGTRPETFDMTPYGGDLWRASFEWDGRLPRQRQVCATDRVGNTSCSS